MRPFIVIINFLFLIPFCTLLCSCKNKDKDIKVETAQVDESGTQNQASNAAIITVKDLDGIWYAEENSCDSPAVFVISNGVANYADSDPAKISLRGDSLYMGDEGYGFSLRGNRLELRPVYPQEVWVYYRNNCAKSNANQKYSLCHSSEQDLFSCRGNAKVFSLCSDSNLSSTNDKVSFRLGQIGASPEISMNASIYSPDSKVQISMESYPKGSTTEITFLVENSRYTIHYDSHAMSGHASGLFIEENNQVLSYLKCDEESFSQQNIDWILSLKVPFTQSVRHLGTPEE